MRSFFLTIFIPLLLAASALAQPVTDQLDIQLNQSIFQPGDSLRLKVAYNEGSAQKKQSPATIELIIENENGVRTRLR